MENIEQRLVNVFETVFPELPEDRIRTASQDTVPAWDSVAAITLINVMEEEFGFQIDFDLAADLTSFPEILDYVNETLSAAA